MALVDAICARLLRRAAQQSRITLQSEPRPTMGAYLSELRLDPVNGPPGSRTLEAGSGSENDPIHLDVFDAPSTPELESSVGSSVDTDQHGATTLPPTFYSNRISGATRDSIIVSTLGATPSVSLPGPTQAPIAGSGLGLGSGSIPASTLGATQGTMPIFNLAQNAGPGLGSPFGLGSGSVGALPGSASVPMIEGIPIFDYDRSPAGYGTGTSGTAPGAATLGTFPSSNLELGFAGSSGSGTVPGAGGGVILWSPPPPKGRGKKRNGRANLAALDLEHLQR